MSSYTIEVDGVTVDRKLWEYLKSIDTGVSADSLDEIGQKALLFDILKNVLDAGKITDTEKDTLVLAHKLLFKTLPVISQGIELILKVA